MHTSQTDRGSSQSLWLLLLSRKKSSRTASAKERSSDIVGPRRTRLHIIRSSSASTTATLHIYSACVHASRMGTASRRDPTDLFTISERHDVPEFHKIHISPDVEALKL